jgi:hypothetical protein
VAILQRCHCEEQSDFFIFVIASLNASGVQAWQSIFLIDRFPNPFWKYEVATPAFRRARNDRFFSFLIKDTQPPSINLANFFSLSYKFKDGFR